MIDVDIVLGRANEIYNSVRGRNMESEQIRALAKAIVEEVNDALRQVADRFDDEVRHIWQRDDA